MFGRVPATCPNISESHSEIRTRVPFCIAGLETQDWYRDVFVQTSRLLNFPTIYDKHKSPQCDGGFGKSCCAQDVANVTAAMGLGCYRYEPKTDHSVAGNTAGGTVAGMCYACHCDLEAKAAKAAGAGAAPAEYCQDYEAN